jgi:hypothetical protein
MKLPIELTLEESGVLCHLLLQSLIRVQRSDPFSERMAALYERLCEVNDKLMGKK